jgi:transketolase
MITTMDERCAKGPAISAPSIAPAGISTSASGSSPWAPCGVGEDGPTHQPVEHLASLRAIPGLITLRPAEANEAVEGWRVILQLRHEPVALILTRQALPILDRTRYASADGLQRGAYVLADADNAKPDILLLATGSEVALCIEAYEELTAEGIRARVVSMPSWELFEHYCPEHPDYREQVLPDAVTARVSVQQGATLGWARYVGRHGHGIGEHQQRLGAVEAKAQKLERQGTSLRATLDDQFGFDAIIGRAPKFVAAVNDTRKVAATTVLLTGKKAG